MTTILTLGARRRGGAYPLPRSATAAPWNSSTTPCVIPTPDGSGATIHPTVLDMGGEWNGYRWWMGNTPYANASDYLENPCIWGSNDRRTWEVPQGLTNPITLPDTGWFYSDTELAWDPDTDLLWLFYRHAKQGTGILLHAASSHDGVEWTIHRDIAALPLTGSRASPSVWRVGPADWRMWLFGGSTARLWTAAGPLGPWTSAADCPGLGGWHADVIHHDGQWWAMSSDLGSNTFSVTSSADGVNWATGARIITGGAGGGWDTGTYRPTLLPSTLAGHMDVWYSAYGDVPGGCATDYVRLPLSLWPAPPA